MAFGGRELRLILSIQSYGTSNFSKVRRDVEALERATKAANLNQIAVQQQMVRKAEQLARTQDRINTMETAAINKRASLQTRAMNAELAYRQKIGNQAIAVENALGAKRIQIGKSADRLAQMRGSGMAKFGVAENNLVTKAMQLEVQKGAIQRSGLGLDAQRLRNLATQSSLERRLVSTAGAHRAQEIMNAKQIERFTLGPATKELAYRYHAAAIEAEKISQAQAAIPRQVAVVESQLSTVLKQEELISQQKLEQAAAIGRQSEVLQLQNTQLQAIETRQAEIAAEVARISKQEALINPELDAQLATLTEENIQLQRAKVLVGEQAAELQRLGGIQLKNAAIADAAVAKQNKMLSLQTGARTAAHIGRTAQFSGLLGVAGLGLAASQFADFDLATAKAATQLRGVGESFASASGASGKLQKDIIDMTREFPASAKDMANSAYEIASGMDFAGNSTERLAMTEKLLKAANGVAIAGQTDLASATDTVVTAFNNFDPAVRNVPGMLNTLFAIVRFGKGDFTQFASVFGRLAAAAHASGATLKEAGGALAYLSTVLPRPAATAGLARLYQILSRKEFVAGMKALGIPITIKVNGVDKLKPLSQIIGDIVRNSPKLRAGGLALRNFIPGVTSKGQQALGQKGGVGLQGTQQATVVLTDLIKGYPQYRDVLKNVMNDNNEFTLSLKKIQQTPGFKWQLAIAQFKAFAITIGQYVLPVLARFLGFIVRLIHRFENLSPHTKKIISQLATFGAVLLLVGGTITAVVGSLAGMALALSFIGPEFILIAAAAGVAATLIVKHWDQVTLYFDYLTQVLPIVFDKMWALIVTGAEGAAAAIIYPFKEAIHILGKLPNIVLGTMGLNQKKLNAAEHAMGSVGRSAGKSLERARNDQGRINDIRTQIFGGSKVEKEYAKIAPSQQYYAAHGKGAKAATTATNTFNKALKENLKLYMNDAKANALMQYLQQFQTQGTDKNTKALKAATNATNSLTNAKLRLQSATLRVQQAEQAATQQLMGAFGGIGQGPLSQGPLGQIFQNLNSTISGFGGKPIKLPVQLILGDQAAQQRNFDSLTTDLNFFQKTLTKNKLPKVFVQMQTQALLEQGTAALPLLEGIKHMNPGQLKQYITGLKKEAKAIEKAKASPFETELKAANIQLKAANIQLQIAKNNVKSAKERTTHQVHYHGNTYNIPAGSTAKETIAMIKRRDIANRNKGAKK